MRNCMPAVLHEKTKKGVKRMPNHVMNVVTFNGSNKRVQEILEEIKDDEIGYGGIDFNKIDPMPTELNIESGISTVKRGNSDGRRIGTN